jgi:hypothetical protein
VPALWWHIFEVLLIAAIVFQGYWRYRRFKSALPPPSPADRGVRFGPFIQGPGEWWKLPATLLTVAIAGFLVWQNARWNTRTSSGFCLSLSLVR